MENPKMTRIQKDERIGLLESLLRDFPESHSQLVLARERAQAAVLEARERYNKQLAELLDLVMEAS